MGPINYKVIRMCRLEKSNYQHRRKRENVYFEILIFYLRTRISQPWSAKKRETRSIVIAVIPAAKRGSVVTVLYRTEEQEKFQLAISRTIWKPDMTVQWTISSAFTVNAAFAGTKQFWIPRSERYPVQELMDMFGICSGYRYPDLFRKVQVYV